MDKVDINILELAKQKFEGLKQSMLKLELYGKSINSSFINSLRRISLLHIPTYAFCKNSIEITENTSVLNNDYMKLRLEQLTYPNLKNNIINLPEKYWKDINYSNIKRDRHPDDKINIEYIINITNNNDETLNVTTNDLTIYENGDKVEKFDKKYPSLILQLKSGQSFKCRAICVLGIGLRNDIWAAAANCYFQIIDENKYKFILESQGQLDEYDILVKACQIMVDKMNKLKIYFEEKFNSIDFKTTNEITLELDNEDIMVGNLLNETFQMNKNILFSGISRPYSFNKTVFIKLQTSKNNPIPYIFESIDYIIECYKTLENKITKINKTK